MADRVENIDIRILRLLGLEDVFDLDYDDYYQLLREAIQKGSFGNNKLSQEELARLANERKRVRGKKGRFKPNAKDPNVSRGNAINFISPSKKNINATNIQRESKKDSLLDIVTAIRKSVEKIYDILTLQLSLLQRNYELSRRRGETEGRRRREDDLENSFKKIGGLVSKVLAPVQGILDKIFKFIMFTLLGQAVTALFDWLKNPENKKKFDSLIRFFGDHWKLFAGIFILFGTSFGAFVRGMLKAVARGLIALAINIPKIKSFLRRNPRLAMLGVGVASLGSGMIANTLNPPEAKKEGNQFKGDDYKETKTSLDKIPQTNIPTLSMGGMKPQFPKIGIYGAAQKEQPFNIIDGMVGDRGIPFTGGGKDNRLFPTADGGFVGLHGREFIVNEGGVNLVGVPFLQAINTMGGGSKANKAKMIPSKNVKLSSSGGPINIRRFKDGGPLQGMRNMIGGAGSALLNGVGNTLLNIIKPGSAKATSSKPSLKTSNTGTQAQIPEHRTPEVKAFLRTIRFAEHSGSGNPYNVIFGGAEVPLTKMTVKEVIDMQNSDMLPKRFGGGPAPFSKGGTWSSVASGAYQFMPDALTDLIRWNVIKPSDVMTPDIQDKAGWALASKKRGLTLDSLRKNKLSIANLDRIAPEWASFPYSPKGGQSYYGQPVKTPSQIQSIYEKSLLQIMGPQSYAPPPGPPVRGKMSTIMLPEINLPPERIASNQKMTNIGDEDMNVKPTDPASQRTRSEVMSILNIGMKPA